MDEARKMAKDAIAGYVASLLKHKEPIPADEETLVTTLDRECARVPGVRPCEVIRFLEKHGFSLDHISESHFIYRQPGF